MRALLDTNIIIHRESGRTVNQDIGILYKWLEKAKYTKCIHPATIDEITKNPNKETVKSFLIKMQNYQELKTKAPWSTAMDVIAERFDINDNDHIDTLLLNEVYSNRVNLLITEDRKIRTKAKELGVLDKVLTINAFLEKVYAEFPELVDYEVLSVQSRYFGELNIADRFFDTLREDYNGFDEWFNKKADDKAYVTLNRGNKHILSFLYLKVENKDEPYSNIVPVFKPKKRLKVGTFKVVSNGVRLGERFMKIIFDNAIRQKVDEIYVTIYNKREEQSRLISLLEEWGFLYFGTKGDDGELVYVRDFTPCFMPERPKKTYPYFGVKQNIFLVPIYPEYHTELLPDSILNNESKEDFKDDQPHSNAIRKVYVSRSIERDIEKGDLLIFYRTGGFYKSVVTTIAVVESIYKDFSGIDDFVAKCRNRSVLPNEKIKTYWNSEKPASFLVNFLYVYSLPNRINLKRLIELGVIKDRESAPRGFQKITKEQFFQIVQDTKSDESFIID